MKTQRSVTYRRDKSPVNQGVRGRDGSGKALGDRLIAAALRCGLTRRQAAELLAETIVVGIACARAPERREELASALDRRTADLVRGLTRVRAEMRGAA